MQIPIVSGIFTDESANFRAKYPINYMPISQEQGISSGYLRPAQGIIEWSVGPGVDRGSVNRNGAHYRVMGTSLVSIDFDGVITTLATIPGTDQVTLDYSFARLGIAAEGNLYYWDDTTLTQVTDPDLGTVIDFIWVDGYFMTTDGEFLVVTDLDDPFSVNPFKYGSSEANPDPITALIKLRNEPYALNRFTIEVFSNVGGSGFPFQRIEGAQIQRGCVGVHACAVFLESVAFLGGGRGEPISVWLGSNGVSRKIASKEIDEILQTYEEEKLAKAIFEVQTEKNVDQLYIRLEDKTLVYDALTSQQIGQPSWFILHSDLEFLTEYRGANRVFINDRWCVGDTQSGKLGYLTDTVSSHWGEEIGWEFGTNIIYNESNGAIFHELELVGLPGRVALGVDPKIYTSFSFDGEEFSQERSIDAGKQGERLKRLVWHKQGMMRNYRMQKFRGTSKTFASFARLEARIEPLRY